MLLPLHSSLHRFLTRIEDRYDRRRDPRPLDFLPLSVSDLIWGIPLRLMIWILIKKSMVSQGQVIRNALHPMQDLQALPIMIPCYRILLMIVRTFLWIIQHHLNLLFPMMMILSPMITWKKKPMVSQSYIILDRLHLVQDINLMQDVDLRALSMIITTFLWIIQHYQYLLFPMMMLACIWEKILMVKSMAYPTYVDLDGLRMVLKR